MLSRALTVALLWILAAGPAAPVRARLPAIVEDAIQQGLMRAGKTLRNEIPLSQTIPIRPG